MLGVTGIPHRNRTSPWRACLLLVAGPALWWTLGPGSDAAAPPPRLAPRPALVPDRGAPDRGFPETASKRTAVHAAEPRPGAADASGTAARERLPDWLGRALGERVVTGAPLVTNRLLPAGGSPPFDARDLAALADWIDANGLHEGSSRFDYDDGDGVFEPWELGFQVWEGSRLVALSFGPDPHASFEYALEVVPESLGDLSALVHLDLSGNRIERLPPSLGDLRGLQQLRLNRNRIGELPSSLGELGSLRSLNLSQNRIGDLPDEARRLWSLEQLHLDDNPISRLPAAVTGLESLRLLSVTHAAQGPDAAREAPGGLRELPQDWLGTTPQPVVLYVSGNRLCGPGATSTLFSDGTRVLGLSAQRCLASGAP